MRDQALTAAVIYTVITGVFSVLAILFSWATFKAPLYAMTAPFLGTVLFLCLAVASCAAALYCIRRMS